MAHLNIDEITSDVIYDIVTNCTSSTIFTVQKILNRMFELALVHKMIDQNPLTHVVFPKRKHQKVTQYLSDKQIVDVINELQDSFYLTPFLLCLFAGLRRGEALGLTWDCVDFDRGKILVSNQLKKTEHGLQLVELKTESSVGLIRIPKFLAEHLLNEKNKRNTLSKFVAQKPDGSPIHPAAFYYKMKRVYKKCGFNFNLQGLRHTHATMLIEEDVSLVVVSERLRHADPRTTLTFYSHLTDKLDRSAMCKLDTKIDILDLNVKNINKNTF